VISASIDASFRLGPHESAFFSRTCKAHISGSCPLSGHAQASAPQAPWCVLYLWLQKGIRENMAWPEAIEFYALSCGSSRKPACNVVETAQRKSQITSATPVFSPAHSGLQNAFPDTSHIPSCCRSDNTYVCTFHTPPCTAHEPHLNLLNPAGQRRKDHSYSSCL
jgi:hypothetical protein